MESPELFVLVAAALAIAYCGMLLIQTICWLKIPEFNHQVTQAKTKLSVIIAMRDEEMNIPACLESLLNQHYPVELFEVIIMDDHSTDGSARLVESFMQKHPGFPLQLLRLTATEEKSSYKKFAISEGIKRAKGELIITTDADCTAGRKWLSTIAAFYENHKPVMIMAPVSFTDNLSFFSRMQSLEFAGLIGMSAASNKAGYPLMCNGANLAYSKKAFEDINGFGNTPALASGDDTFLLFKMKEKFPGRILFLKSTEANVTTAAKTSLNDFFQQRKRWASKTTKYQKQYVTLTGLLIYFFNLFLAASFILSIVIPVMWLFSILLLVMKFIFEFIFMAVVCRFFRKEKLLWTFLPTALLFIPYILIVGIAAPFGTYQWKGRTVK